MVSVIIPNYNGKHLLKKSLPQVIKYLPKCEIIVVDDGSQDGSADYIKKNFKEVSILELEKNMGFSQAVNRGVTKSKGDLIILLNSDVVPKSYLTDTARDYFNDKKTFAVAFLDLSHEKGKIIKRGRGGARIKQGFLNHFSAKPVKGMTFWVSAGSGMFDKKKYLQLGGLDKIFRPFYWEDIDLSYRAQKAGYKCFFEPKIQVDHFHEEGAIKKYKSKFKIKSASYKNQYLFIWKNISSINLLLAHLMWQPYHFIKALIRADAPYFIGVGWAISLIPELIFQSPKTISEISDEEILNHYERQQ